ncbi:DEAD/DEAH box helicase [Treponema sp.]|uniref:DEAD/DEAH box helicase n=1 Tax=Treponema sp. TaxID=166 RepID=UPI0038901D38
MSAEVSAENDSDEMSFEDLGLDEITLKAIEKKGFKVPSPIQVLAIPRLLNGDANVIARARTGTGKTAAFGLPLVQTLREPSDHVRAIILEPTRELAMQTAAEMASFTTGKCPRVAVVYGGASMGEQMRALRKGVEIVVGTPGRVMDLMDRGVLDISKIDYFILDEGDEMLDMGFVDDIENIFESANQDCRVLLFSATIPKEILRIAQRFMGDYEIVEEEGVVEEPLLIDQKYWVLKESEKIEALVRLIDISPDFFGLVFVQRKCDADYVSKALDEKGYEAAALHGDIPQGQREKILARFRAKKTRILVATDVAARGIDIEGLTHVVNYELPFDGPTYVHRIGRTGRAGSSGVAVTFVKPEDTRRKLNYLINAVRKSAKGEMTEGTIPGVEEVLEAKRGRLFDDIKSKIGLNNVPAETVSDDDEIVPMEGEGSEVSVEEKVPHLRKGDAIFDTLAEELCNGQDAKEVVASLLAATYGSVLSRNRYGKISTVGGRKDRNGRGDRGGRDVGYEQVRIYAQMGWDDGYNPRKIADFFHDLLGVPGRKVDAIDMADNFCLLSLPADDARRAIELSEKDKSLPHMHVDTKVAIGGGDEGGRRGGRGRGDRGGRRDGGFGRDRDRSFGRDRGGRDRDRGFGRDRDGGRFGRDRDRDRSRGGSHSRPNVHTATQRSGSASFFKKSSGATEY